MPSVVEGEETSYPDNHGESSRGHRQSAFQEVARKYKYYIAGGSVVLLIILSVVIGVSVNSGNSSSSSSQSNASGTSSDRKRADLMGRIKSSFTVLGLPATHSSMLDSSESPQARALNWVATSDTYDGYSDDQRLQRYALASFFYGTYAVRNAYVTQQVPWTTAEKWLSDENECEWEGITCDGNNAVTKIELEEHRVSGGIPLDIVLMRESLKELVLTNNLIFMEGDALEVFGYLENLEVLMLADNYIVERNGLPQSLRELRNLKKLILSYNLLQGAIRPAYFSDLGKLTHLEIESNYLTGPLPESIYDMDQLVYLYARRNDLHFGLGHAISKANWPNMCTFQLFSFVFFFYRYVTLSHN